jgi:hypothetical protein
MGIFTNFVADDDVLSSISTVTSGMWSGGDGTMTTFYTSSVQSGSTGEHYYDVYQGAVGTDATSSVQFSVTYGHYAGSGSLTGDSSNNASKAIYSQLRNLLLPASQTKFKWLTPTGSTDTSDIFAISLNRSRLKEKMDPGNWELHISGSNGTQFKLIDDSGATTDPTVQQTTREFNVISGSIASGTAVSDVDAKYGKFYPETGMLILTPIAFHATPSTIFAGFGTAANVNADNSRIFYDAIKGPDENGVQSGLFSGSFAARREEQIKSTHYFCRVGHAKYNHSQNPTYYTGTNADLAVPSFRTDPKSYITTVGLYNESSELLAVAKLSKPILKTKSREALIKVRLDF